MEILRGNKKIIERREKESEKAAISFMSVAELYYGAEKSHYPDENKILIESFLLSVDIVNSDLEIMKMFARLKGNLSESRTLLADADLFIASAALVKAKKLITGNIKRFSRINELMIENWVGGQKKQ